MKRWVIIIISTILITAIIIGDIVLFLYTKLKKNEIKTKFTEFYELVPLEKELNFEFDTDVNLKDILDLDFDEKINTDDLGEKNYLLKSPNSNKYYSINYTVKDTTAPLIMGSTTKTVVKGKTIDLVNSFLCGDNHDSVPKCYIEGNYNVNKLGSYKLKYVAEDTSGNKSTKDFTLKVVSSSSSSSSSNPKKTPIKTYIDKYKKDNTKIGIDVSAWQDDINWKKVKDAGVEFAILRIGYGPSSGELKLDKWFENNIKKAKEANVPLGVYFYSYAGSKEEAVKQAKWIVEKLNGQKLELPIAFDWEDWGDFNDYKVSFKELNDIAAAFIEEVEKNDYKGMLYSSAYYLNHIWKEFDTTWLAYYTSNNDFEKPYSIWQLSSTGSVSGIDGYVDINVMYDDKNKH